MCKVSNDSNGFKRTVFVRKGFSTRYSICKTDLSAATLVRSCCFLGRSRQLKKSAHIVRLALL